MMMTDEEIPKWVWWMAGSLLLFTVFCFGIMLAGMIYV